MKRRTINLNSESSESYHSRMLNSFFEKYNVEVINTELKKAIDNIEGKKEIVADLGAGTLYYVPLISEYKRIFVQDIDNRRLNYGYKKIKPRLKEKIVMKCSSVLNSNSFKNQEINLIIAIGLIDYLDKSSLSVFFSNCWNWLKKNGYCILVFPNAKSLAHIPWILYTKIKGLNDKNRYTISELKQYIDGFTIVESKSIGAGFWLPKIFQNHFVTNIYSFNEKNRLMRRILPGCNYLMIIKKNYE